MKSNARVAMRSCIRRRARRMRASAPTRASRIASPVVARRRRAVAARARARATRDDDVMPAAARALADACGGADALLALAERHATRDRAVAASIARVALRAALEGDDDARRRVDAVERAYAEESARRAYEEEIARAARAQRNRDVAKRKTRPRDRTCNRPKARQGWTRAAMRERKARTCAACERIAAKADMFRAVRVKTTEGGTRVVVGSDARGASGRSAYVCKTRACAARAAKGKALHRALRCNVDRGVYDALEREARALEEAMGVDTSNYVFVRPEGTSARWKAPGEWVPSTPEA